MAEYNGKKFYGYSMENDPDLVGTTWSTKNFEFSCIRPETVQRAIEKVNSDVGASLKQKKSHLLNKLREQCGGDAESENQSYPNRDMDVETRISQANNSSNTLQFGHIHARIKAMNNREKCISDNSSHSYSGDDSMAQTISNKTERVKGGENTIDGKNLQKIVFQEYQQPQPSWVEITEPKTATMQMFDLRRPPPPPPPFGYPPNLFQMPAYQYMPPTPQALPNLNYIYDQPQMMDYYPYQNPYGDCDPNAYQVEDSDLEDEMIRREHYTKFCEKRPEINDTLATEENESCAEFVNIAPQEPYTDMSCLKSTVPMRYSELSDENVKEEIEPQHPKVIIKNRKQGEVNFKIPGKISQRNSGKKAPTKEKTTKQKTTSFAKLLEQERIISNQHAKVTKTSARRQAKRNTSPPASRLGHKPSSHRTPHDSYTNEQEYRNMNPMTTVNGKSIEQLKAEKVAIFNKMSRTHERLIDALQQLRAKLLEVYVPESNSDRQRRNRNGFEFSVRFLRNFLYPLKGMIDTARNTSREQFNSIKSNEACNRVAHIYSLFLQAVFTYSKQLRHFMIDQVPQKLTTLLEMLYGTINMCLDKRLFDRNDAIVECLQSHCAHFLSFLEDLHAQRFVVTRESYRKIAEERQNSKFDLKMFMNDLNMYEPKVVPKRLVNHRQRFAVHKPSKTSNSASAHATSNSQIVQNPAHCQRKKVKSTKKVAKQHQEKSDMTSQSTSEVNEFKGLEDDVPTQVQNWNPRSSDVEQESGEVLQNLQNILQHSPKLGKYKKVDKINDSLLNALRQSKQHPSREILQPLLKTIEDVLDIEKDDDEIEQILKALRMKISTLLKEEKFQHEDKAFIPVSDPSELEFSRLHDEDASSEESDNHTDPNDEQSDKNIQQSINNDQTHFNDNIVFINDVDYDKTNVDEEEDKDGQFYISGEDYSSRKPTNTTTTTTTTTRVQKTKHEPLVEIVDKSEADELYSSDAEIYTPSIRANKSPTKPLSPYVVPSNRRNNKTQKLSKSPAPKKSNSNKTAQNPVSTASSIKKTNTKIKSTTIPPSPAMMRLKQLGQQPILTERSKKNNLLKKRSHRNPMGSPPPPPTVSPSTSLGHCLSKNVGDLHISQSNTSSSHKGCSVNISKHEIMSSSELSHHEMTHSENEINFDCIFKGKSNSSSKSALSRPKTTHNLENKKPCDGCHTIGEENESDNEDIVRARMEQNNQIAPADALDGSLRVDGKNSKDKDHSHGDQKENPNTNDVDETVHENGDTQVKSKEKNIKINFDESPLLKERDKYLSLCIRNRLYTNPNFATPWKILSKLSHQLARDIVKDVEADFNAGVLNFVDDFLELETRI